MSEPVRNNRASGVISGARDERFPGSSRQVAIRFSDETFNEIKQRSIAQDKSFGWIGRELVAIGLGRP